MDFSLYFWPDWLTFLSNNWFPNSTLPITWHVREYLKYRGLYIIFNHHGKSSRPRKIHFSNNIKDWTEVMYLIFLSKADCGNAEKKQKKLLYCQMNSRNTFFPTLCWLSTILNKNYSLHENAYSYVHDEGESKWETHSSIIIQFKILTPGFDPVSSGIIDVYVNAQLTNTK